MVSSKITRVSLSPFNHALLRGTLPTELSANGIPIDVALVFLVGLHRFSDGDKQGRFGVGPSSWFGESRSEQRRRINVSRRRDLTISAE